jgi:hypothetical protein
MKKVVGLFNFCDLEDMDRSNKLLYEPNHATPIDWKVYKKMFTWLNCLWAVSGSKREYHTKPSL